MAQPMPDMSKSATSGWFTASQYMAGTAVSTLIRSAGMRRRNSRTSKPGMTTEVPPTATVTSSCPLHPVTWNRGTATRLRASGRYAGTCAARNVFSQLVSRFSWVCMAPLGKPVVPEV